MKKVLILSLLLSLFFSVKAQNETRWEAEIKAFEKQDSQHTKKKKVILFTGSSSIRRWGNLSSYFPGKNVLNRGFGGSHASDLIHYADRVTGNYNIKQILIYEGDNDLASGKTVDRVVKDLKTIVEHYRKKYPKAVISILSIKPSPARIQFLPQIQEVNQQMNTYMSAGRRLQYIDVYTPLMKDGRPIPEIFVSDGIHMNADGYKLWTAAIKPYLN